MKTMKTKKGKEVEVPEYFTLPIGSDAFPYETVEVISEQTVVVRSMKSKLDPTWKPDFHIGGFAAHCSNQRSQRYFYESNPNGKTVRLRKKKNPRKIFKGWDDTTQTRIYNEVYDWGAGYNVFQPTEKPYKFHDYNF